MSENTAAKVGEKPSDALPVFTLEDMALDGGGFTPKTLRTILKGDENLIANFDRSGGHLESHSQRDVQLTKQRIVTINAMLSMSE